MKRGVLISALAKTNSEQAVRQNGRRNLLVIVLGIAFLVIVTGLGTFVTNYMPAMHTPQTQTAQAGSYTVTLRIDPNPPANNQPATFSIGIQQSASHQSVDRAHVVLDGTMEDMGLDTSAITARAQGAGIYVARVPFSMSGSWQVQVSISLPGQPTVNAMFAVTAQ
jgi:hypothetical protein